MDFYTLLTVGEIVVAIIGITLIVWELHQTKNVAKNDMDRRRKDATFQNYQQNRNDILSSHVNISQFLDRNHYDRIPLTDEEQEKIQGDDHISKELEVLFANLERLSLGVNQEVFDEDILYHLTAASFYGFFKRYEPYILHQREKRFSTYLIEFEWVAKRFEKRLVKEGTITLS